MCIPCLHAHKQGKTVANSKYYDRFKKNYSNLMYQYNKKGLNEKNIIKVAKKKDEEEIDKTT